MHIPEGQTRFNPSDLSQFRIIVIKSLIQAQQVISLRPVICADLLSSVIKSYLHVSDARKLVDSVLATRP